MDLLIEVLGANLSTAGNWTKWHVESDTQRFWIERLDTDWWFWFKDGAWPALSFLLVTIYFLAVLLIEKYMRDKAPLRNLSSVMVPFFLANILFAGMTAYRTLPRMMNALFTNGFHGMLCLRDDPLTHEFAWVVAYNLSKPFQFVDTFFLLLQKKRVPLFHYYHHASMALTVAAVTRYWEPFTYFMMAVNAVQHLIIYPYLLAKVLRITLPHGMPKAIALLELSTMMLGLWATNYTIRALQNGKYCARHPTSVKVCAITMIGMLTLVMHTLYTKSGKVTRKQRKLNDEKTKKNKME